jgi:hypothetical protein
VQYARAISRCDSRGATRAVSWLQVMKLKFPSAVSASRRRGSYSSRNSLIGVPESALK